MTYTPTDEDLAVGLNVVRRLARQFGANASSREEFFSAGLVGLARACASYRRKHRVLFGTYAAFRVRGAMLDFIRLERGREDMQDDTGRLHRDGHKPKVRLMFLNDMCRTEDLNSIPFVSPDADWWEYMLRGLSREDRLMMKLLYQAGFTMKQAGRVIGISEPRVCQRHKAVLSFLRCRLTRQGKEEELRAAI